MEENTEMDGAEVIIHLGPTQVYFDGGLPIIYKTVNYVDGTFNYEEVKEYIQYGQSIRLKNIKTIVHQASMGKGYCWVKI